MYLPHKNNWIYSSLISLISTGLIFILFGFFTLAKFLAVWDDTTIIYTNKNNPEVKIVSRYVNLGAYGGGTEPEDYEIVVKRPLTRFLKIETSVDTTAINKKEWVREY
jgi:hypothetical protein